MFIPIYPACDAQALYCNLWTVRLYKIEEKKFIDHKMFVLIFSTILPEIFLILRRNDGHMIINVHWSSCKVTAIHVRF